MRSETMQKHEYIELELDKDYKDIPFQEVKRLIEILPRAKRHRVALMWLSLTGARPSEIEKRKISEIAFGIYWIWKPRKNQKGYRREKLPSFFWEEFNEYLEKESYSNDDVFGLLGESLSSYVNRYIRPLLGGNWIKKRPEFREDGKYRLVYIYQIKNLRHNYQTCEWARYKEEYGSDLALMKVSRKMRHSSKRITGEHYIESVEHLNLNSHKHKTMGEILQGVDQMNLMNYF